MKIKGLTSLSALCVLLAACGGGDDACVENPLNTNNCAGVADDDTVDDVITTESGPSAATNSDTIQVSYNANETATTDDDTLTIVGANFEDRGRYLRDPSLDRNGFLGFRDDFRFPSGEGIQETQYDAIHGTSTSGEMIVYASATGDYRDFGDFIAGFETNAGSQQLATGSANYTGNYAGILIYNNAAGLNHTEGNVLILLDNFTDPAAKGSITNRVVTSNDGPIAAGTALPDVVLNDSTFNADTQVFTGTANSYDGSDLTEPLEGGTYSLSTGGPNGSEVAGYLDISSTELDGRAGVTTREIGVFTGDCTTAVDEFGEQRLICNP